MDTAELSLLYDLLTAVEAAPTRTHEFVTVLVDKRGSQQFKTALKRIEHLVEQANPESPEFRNALLKTANSHSAADQAVRRVLAKG